MPNILKVSCTSTEEVEDPYPIHAQNTFNRMSPQADRDFLSYAMSGNKECADYLEAVLEQSNMTLEEMYNRAAEEEDPVVSGN